LTVPISAGFLLQSACASQASLLPSLLHRHAATPYLQHATSTRALLSAWLASSTPLRLHPLDLGIVLLYLVGITIFGLQFRSSKDRSLRGYFLAGRTIPWWAIGLSIVSAETSTLTIISIPGVAYAGDMGFLQVVFGYMIGRIVVALLFLPRYFQGEMLTAYQLIDQRFGHTLHKVTAGLFLVTRAAAEGVRVFAVSIVVGIAIGTGDVASIAIISAMTLLYTFEGGMAAVVWTDVVQMAIYIFGTVVALATLGSHVHGGWGAIHTVGVAAGKFHLLHFAWNLSESYTFWAGVFGGTFLTMASHGTDQLMVQRMLAAKNLAESRLALLSSGVVILLQFTLFLLIGVGLFVFYGQHPQVFAGGAGSPVTPDRIFPTFIVREMPTGVAGLLIAAILAAAMSNLSAALNSLSSTTVVDFYMPWRPDAGDRERANLSRGSTVLWAFVLFAIAIYAVHVGGKGHVVEVGLSIASVAYGSLLGVFLLGTLTRQATEAGAIVGMVVGFALNLLLWRHPGALVLGPFTLPHIAFTWYVLIGSAVTFLVGSLASLVLGRRPRPRNIVAGLLLTVFCLPPGVRAQSAMVRSPTSTPQPDFSAVDRLMTDALAAKKLPGAVIQVGHGGQVVFRKAYGNRAEDPAIEPMTVDTIFDMASLTKCLATATAIMQIYEQGKLQFDDPIDKYLPAFSAGIARREKRTDQHTPPDKAKVTIRMLLTHTSGEAPDVDLKDPWGLAKPDKAEGIHRALTTPLQSTPGEVFRYSDINFILLGDLVETLSGQPLETYAAEHIFKPLGMTRTGFHPFSKTCGPVRRIGANIEPGPKPIGFIRVACPPVTWNPLALDPLTAPTAHDNELTADQNPDFDHMLRGTVHDPTTRRMGGVAGQAGVFSTTHDIGLYAQALLDRLAGRPSTFPLKQSTLDLMTTPEQPGHSAADLAQIPAGAVVTYPSHKGHDVRAFGWDIDTAFSRPRGVAFPLGSFGHTGFTGTTLWMDPGSDTYLVLLANAVHPRGRGAISGLRGDVATAVARALNLYPERAGATAAPAPGTAHSVSVQTGLDVLESTNYAALAEASARHAGHLRLGLLTNQTGLDQTGHRTIDLLATQTPKAVPGLVLTTLFSPEHGIAGVKDSTEVANTFDPTTHLPVISLYGPKDADRRPRLEDLKKLDAVIIDLQDAGVRFYTYETVVGYFVEAAAKAGIELIVLDRPNPIGGLSIQGPVSDPGTESYTNYMSIPVRHGLTLGELARYINGERHLGAQLTVVPVQGWRRDMDFNATGLPWTNPSPNLRSPRAALLYPGVALLEMTNVSVGRGTEAPFEALAAPFLDSTALTTFFFSRQISGVAVAPTHLTPAKPYPYAGERVPGLQFTLTGTPADRLAFEATEFGIELISALHHLYPGQFNLAKAARLIANAETMRALERGDDPRAIAAGWQPALSAFRERRQPYLLYP